ncbi:MAG: Tex-like N-terminal domain-containing protein [Pirellulaceae bacterium]
METTSSNSLNMDAIAKQMGISVDSVQATIELLDEGNTVPFITRYRKIARADWTNSRFGKSMTCTRCSDSFLNASKGAEVDSQSGKTDAGAGAEHPVCRFAQIAGRLVFALQAQKQTLATLAKQKTWSRWPKKFWMPIPWRPTLPPAARTGQSGKWFGHLKEVENGVRSILAEHFSELVRLRSLVRRYMWQAQFPANESKPRPMTMIQMPMPMPSILATKNGPPINRPQSTANTLDSEETPTSAADAETPSVESESPSSPTATDSPTTDAGSTTANYSSESNEPAAPAVQVVADAPVLNDDTATPKWRP